MQSREENKLFRKKLISLVLPIAFQQFMLALMSASDAFMLVLISQNAMSAASLATQVAFVENLFLAAMTIGLSTLAAQYWGKGDQQSLEKIFAFVLKITVAVCFVFFIVTLCVPQLLMKLLTNESELIEGGVEYLRVASPSFLFTGISQIYLCALKNSGRVKAASIISSCCVAGNILLNAVFILGLLGVPRLGIAGAALATSVARGVEVAWCLIETARKDRIKLKFRYLLRLDKPLFKSFWKYTTPVLCNEIVWGVAFSMYSVIMGHLGSDAVAAYSLANTMKNLIVCFCMGLASGGAILVGNELGAGNLERAKKYGGKLCIWAIVCGACSGAVILAISPLVVSLANLSAVAKDYFLAMLAMCSYYLIGQSVNSTTIAGIFCAGGDSKFGFLCDCVVMWLIVVPMGFLAAFVFKWSVLAVYFVISLDEMIKMPAVYLHYKKYKWVKDLTAKENCL